LSTDCAGKARLPGQLRTTIFIKKETQAGEPDLRRTDISIPYI
jgi:hypothetical protein